jgi:ubiquitin carboxyl-terminal hydrolase L5
VQEELHSEREKFQRWHDENIRRKTNYVPFVFNLLQLLAEKGQLQAVIDRARQLQIEKANKKRPR